jgi:hypothetical protein
VTLLFVKLNINKSKVFIVAAVLTLVFVAVFFSYGVYAADAANVNRIDRALIQKDMKTLEINGVLQSEYVSANKNATLYLFELLPYQSTSQINDMTPIAEIKIDKEFKFKINDFDSSDKPRMFAKYVVCERPFGEYNIITNARFIDNPEIFAPEKKDAYPTYATKKGLNVQMITDMQELGAAHTVVTVPINEFIIADSSQNAEQYIFNGVSYYIDKLKLENLDYDVKKYTAAGVEVFLNIVLTAPKPETPQSVLSMYYDGASETAKYYAVNTRNEQSILYYEGFLTYLAERYTRNDRQYGFAGSFIIGYEVNSNRINNNMGPASMDSYLNSYVTAFRIAYTAMRSVDPNGKVYISVANNFNRQSKSSDIIADSQLDYAAKALIDSFNIKINYAGNIPWNIAINAYPSDLSNPRIWSDDMTTGTSDTPYITMNNIDVLVSYLSEADYLYNDRTRSILISEFGVTSGVAEMFAVEQAASIALAFYKAQSTSMIDAIIYNRHVDNPADNAINYGLWTTGSDVAPVPYIKKKAYEVFKDMDIIDPTKADWTGEVLQVIGISGWESQIPRFNPPAMVRRDVYKSDPYVDANIEKGRKEKVLFDFSDGNFRGFFPSDNASFIEFRSDSETGKSMLYGRLFSVNAGDYLGIGRLNAGKINVKNVEYITLNVKAEAPAGVDRLDIMLRIYSNGSSTVKSATLQGVATITPGRWETVSFNTKELTDNYPDIDGIKIWIKPSDSLQYADAFGLWIGNILTYDKSGSLLSTILLIILIIILLIIAFFVFIIVRNNIRYARKKKTRMQRMNYTNTRR